MTVFTGFAYMLCVSLFVGLKECFVCAAELSAACLVTSIGGQVVVMCEDHVMLTDLCQAVWQISKSQQVPQAEKTLATSFTHCNAHISLHTLTSIMFLPFGRVLCMPGYAYKVHFETAPFSVLLAGEGVEAREPSISAGETMQASAAVAS